MQMRFARAPCRHLNLKALRDSYLTHAARSRLATVLSAPGR